MTDFKVRNISDLSGIGDSFVNFIYSLAVSNALKKPVGMKASNYVLAEALVRAGLRDSLGSRVSRHEMADYTEGLIFNAWLKKKITVEECTDVLSSRLNGLENRMKLREASINAFADLLLAIAGR